MADDPKAPDLAAQIAGLEAKNRTLREEKRGLEGKVTQLESAALTTTSTHEAALAAAAASTAEAQSAYAGSQREVAYVTNGLTDQKARQFAEFEYSQMDEATRPNYGEYLASITTAETMPAWLKGYMTPAPPVTDPAASDTVPPGDPAAPPAPVGDVPPPPPVAAPAPPAPPTAPPIPADVGAAPVGAGGPPTALDFANMTADTYAESRKGIYKDVE